MENLTDFFNGRKDRPSEKFQVRPVFDFDDDSLSILLKNDDHFSERIDDLLTVYRSFETKQVIGFELKRIIKELKRLEDKIEFNISASKIHVSVLLAERFPHASQEAINVLRELYRETETMNHLKIPVRNNPYQTA